LSKKSSKFLISIWINFEAWMLCRNVQASLSYSKSDKPHDVEKVNIIANAINDVIFFIAFPFVDYGNFL